MSVLRFGSCIAALALALAAISCGPHGAPSGAACTHANQCESQHCYITSDAGGFCATLCTTSADCTTGTVCGRFDYRGTDPDSGMLSGPTSDIVYACRPRLTSVCSATQPCDATHVCTGDPGVCTIACSSAGDCVSSLCLGAPSAGPACAAVGMCAPLCDDIVECPPQWYCNMAVDDTLGHGRCEPIEPIPAADAGVCSDP